MEDASVPLLRPQDKAVKVEPVPADPGQPIASGALRVNLQRTAFTVVIPAEHRLLLDIVERKAGILKQTEALLREIHHPYANWDEIVEPLRSRALGDIHYHIQHPDGIQAIRLMVGFFFEALAKARTPSQRKRACASLLDYVELIAREAAPRRPQETCEVIELVCSRLEEWFSREPLFAARGTSRLKKIVEAVLPAASGPPLILAGLIGLLLAALEHGYALWLEQEDLVEWLAAQKALFDGSDYSALASEVSHERLRGLLSRVQTVRGSGCPLSAESGLEAVSLPSFADIEEQILSIAVRIERGPAKRPIAHKIHYLFHLLNIPLLSDHYERILRDIARCLENIREKESEEYLASFIRTTFEILRDKWDRYASTVLDCVYAIGHEIYRTRNRRLVGLLIDEVVRMGFQYPDIQGVNRDWQVMVNPLHLKNIRVWLSLIELNPGWSRKLISALIVNLRFGGLFVSDTDLFQKDISTLLASDIRPCYGLIKKLARLFPVYFHEIGAEGELRDLSTAIDELCGRHDLLVHFLRKQCHVESNNHIVPFVETIMRFWLTGDKELLRQFLPVEVFEQIPDNDPFQEEMKPLFQKILDQGRLAPQDLLRKSDWELVGAIQAIRSVSEHSRRKAEFLVRLYTLLVKKYTINHHDILRDLEESRYFQKRSLEVFADALQKGNDERAIELLLFFLSVLRDNILSSEPTTAQEEIYRKRHIAAGIPSMYGRYKEKRFDSLGLTFRLESLANVLFSRLTSSLNLEYVTRSTLERVTAILGLCAEALRLDGTVIETFDSTLDLMKQALSLQGCTVDQYLNILQFMARTVKEITDTQYLNIHEATLKVIVPQLLAQGRPLPFGSHQGHTTEEVYYQAAEWFFRDVLANSFVVQILDDFIGKVMASLEKESQTLDRTTRTILLSLDPERCFVPFQSQDTRWDTQLYLGNKGYFLKKLVSYGYPVPPGFIITTEFFRCRQALVAYGPAQKDFSLRLRYEMQKLEKRSGKGFGDPSNPLLVSVRSGSPISMPGMMNTFLNIGINEEITERLAARPRFEWAAWDNYRRFLQCWGMSFGIPRDRFDEIMNETKRIYSARYKRELRPDQMRDLAFSYRRLLKRESIDVPEDPWEQLHTAVHRVVLSWHSDISRLYREAMKIAEEWGTAVVIQQMVFGNLDTDSGTGVLFTRNPKARGADVTLYGDYTVCAQGEDVVAGLVETYPISEEQRSSERAASEASLEKDFPRIFAALKKIAEDLVYKRGFNHQEIEFTFESSDPDSLFILQTRDIIPPEREREERFVPTPELKESLVGIGIGVGGGALCGIAVHRREEIEWYRSRYPGAPIILLRPDTVPDDIDMIFKVDGILTGRGGITSHAAVSAKRLGKTCVVGCSQLHVNETEAKSTVNNKVIRSGDWIGIDGHYGAIYVGRHKTARSSGRADIFR
jgi:pyruvate,orthophosphate dikinase